MTLNQKMHYVVIFSMLFPIPIALIGIPIYLIYGLLTKQIHPILWIKKQPIIHLFFMLSTLTSLLAKNYVGLATTGAIFLLFWYCLILRTQLNDQFFHSSLKIFIIGSWFHGVYAILQHYKILFGPDYHAFHPAMISWRDGRSDSVFLNPNYYAMMCIFFILIALYLFYMKKIKWLLIPTMIINIIGILFTQSRTPLPALIVAIFVFLIIVFKKKQKKFLLFGTGITFFAMPLLQYLPRFDLGTVVSHLVDIRFQIWSVSWTHFTQHVLIGSGPLTYMNIYSQYGSYATQHAHNLYIDSLLNYGIIGVTLLCIIFYKLFCMAKCIHLVPLKALIMSCFSLVLIHGLLDVSILWVHTLFIFTFIIIFGYCQQDVV